MAISSAVELHNPSLMVWGSGSGTTYRAFAECVGEGMIGPVDMPLVITDKPQAGIVDQVAEMNHRFKFGTEIMVINKALHPGGPRGRGQTQEEAERTCGVLQAYPETTLALLGCMRILGDEVIEEFGWSPSLPDAYSDKAVHRSGILNTHTGPVPFTRDMYGLGPSLKVVEAGLLQTAQTLLAVAPGLEGIDAGPIIAEHVIDVPKWRVDTPERRLAAAKLLFGLLQVTEKAHIGPDIWQFLVRKQEYARARP